MSKPWPKQTLGNLCALLSGGTPSKSNPRFWVGDVPFVSARDLKTDRIESASLHISREAVELSAAKLAPVGSLLMLVRGMGLANGIQVGEVTAPVAFNQDVKALVPPPGSVVPRFLLLALRNIFMNAQGEDVLGSAAHGTLKLDTGVLRQIAIPLPPLAEQRRIVAILDQAFASIAIARANAEKNLQNARELFFSHLKEVFAAENHEWVNTKLGDVTTKIGSGATPRGGESSYKAEGISLIRSLNVHDLEFRLEKLAFIDEQQAEALDIVKVQSGDVLLNITGASVARCCIVPEDVLPARVNQHVSIVRVIPERLNAGFLHYLLISPPYKEKLLATGEEGGSTRQAITKVEIQNFSVAYPASIAEQQALTEELRSVRAETERLESVYRRKLAALDELKQSLLHEAFSGEL